MKKWISDLSTTNFRIFVSIVLATIAVLAILAAIVAKRELQVEALYATFGFIALMLGLDVTQFVFKRRTELVNPPEAMAQNVTATTTTTVPAVKATPFGGASQ